MKRIMFSSVRILLLFAFVILAMVSCKKSANKAIEPVTDEPAPSNPDNSGTNPADPPKSVRLKIGTFSSSITNFKPVADEALELLSKVFSSKEFKDSIYKYDYAPSNQLNNPYQCSKAKDLNVIKVDPTKNRINGSMVYDDLLKYKDVALNLVIRKSDVKNVLGSSSYCNFTITSNDYWLKEDDMAMTLPEEYAIHLGHEFCHTLGYYHNDDKHPNTKTEDVAYGTGSLVANILWDWSLKEIKKKELHSYLLDNSNWRLRCLAVEPAKMPQYGKFNDILQLDLATVKAAGRSYNHFYIDFNPPETQRRNGSNVVFGVTTAANGAYWVEYNYYKMDWINTTEGTFKFSYIGNNGSTEATRSYSKNLRNLLDTKRFKMIYSNTKGPTGRVMANFICVEDPEIFFYGKFERTWVNWF